MRYGCFLLFAVIADPLPNKNRVWKRNINHMAKIQNLEHTFSSQKFWIIGFSKRIYIFLILFIQTIVSHLFTYITKITFIKLPTFTLTQHIQVRFINVIYVAFCSREPKLPQGRDDWRKGRYTHILYRQDSGILFLQMYTAHSSVMFSTPFCTSS